jgi:hypothetical protein
MLKANEEDVNYAFAHLPLSSEQILHPKKYWNTKNLDLPIEVTMPDIAPALGKGWKKLGSNVFGELGIAILTMPKPEPEEETEDPGEKNPMAEAMKMLKEKKFTKESRGWGGDRYELYGGPLDGVLLAWVTAWDTENDAKEMEAWLQGAREAGAIGGKGLTTLVTRTETETPAGPLHRVDLIVSSDAALVPVAAKALVDTKFQTLTPEAMAAKPTSRAAKGTQPNKDAKSPESRPAKKDH